MKILSMLLIVVPALLTSCFTSVARYSDFPKTADNLDFESIASVNANRTPLWTKHAVNEYYIEFPAKPDSVLIKAIEKAMQKEGYRVFIADFSVNKVVGERGLRANEWSTLAAAYFKNTKDKSQVYLRCQIKQDATGGWRENRAKKIANTLLEEF
jgi:hypothetical protein